jgi:SM-20-related protein
MTGNPGDADDELIEGLRSDGIAVRDAFLSASEVSALIICAEARRMRGDFAPARIGAKHKLERRAEIRGDSICWLTEAEFDAEAHLLDLLEALRLRLNRDALLGLLDLELHYAWYPTGSGYARHVDQPFGRSQRRLSLVLYLNENWSAEDGGALRVYEEGERYRDIAPIAGRLAVFLTEQRVHEVLSTRRPRLSLTGWFRSRE